MRKPKQIPVWMYHEQVDIFVARNRKRKLTELYPQRAILEESRKASTLVQANDWIDHAYYERLVEQSGEKNNRIFERYGMKVMKKLL